MHRRSKNGRADPVATSAVSGSTWPKQCASEWQLVQFFHVNLLILYVRSGSVDASLVAFTSRLLIGLVYSGGARRGPSRRSSSPRASAPITSCPTFRRTEVCSVLWRLQQVNAAPDATLPPLCSCKYAYIPFRQRLAVAVELVRADMMAASSGPAASPRRWIHVADEIPGHPAAMAQVRPTGVRGLHRR